MYKCLHPFCNKRMFEPSLLCRRFTRFRLFYTLQIKANFSCWLTRRAAGITVQHRDYVLSKDRSPLALQCFALKVSIDRWTFLWSCSLLCVESLKISKNCDTAQPLEINQFSGFREQGLHAK